jgi:hypothetical protein
MGIVHGVGADGSIPFGWAPERVTVSDATAWQIVEDRVVMLDLDSEHYYRLDPVGSRMWELLCENGAVETAHARLIEEYEVDPTELRTDLAEFIARLAAAGLLQVEPPLPAS